MGHLLGHVDGTEVTIANEDGALVHEPYPQPSLGNGVVRLEGDGLLAVGDADVVVGHVGAQAGEEVAGREEAADVDLDDAGNPVAVLLDVHAIYPPGLRVDCLDGPGGDFVHPVVLDGAGHGWRGRLAAGGEVPEDVLEPLPGGRADELPVAPEALEGVLRTREELGHHEVLGPQSLLLPPVVHPHEGVVDVRDGQGRAGAGAPDGPEPGLAG